jgi:NADH:ubiquinone oxidoreductase subunit C
MFLLNNFYNKYFFVVIFKKRMETIIVAVNKKVDLYFLIFFFKNSLFHNYKFLIDMTVVDNIAQKLRFKLVYILQSYFYKTKIFLTSSLKHLEKILSIYKLYKSAIWVEREIYDMFGIKFINNYDLRRILNDYTFFSFPLKKDFPLTGFFELLYIEKFSIIKELKVELMQEFRFLQESSPIED